ncbi:hypothetical protein N177_1160 [Lutibaculum baratangense AMV1]|uniref:Uncharacterized protein n=1 Tax=Lutibaculum baratangense AMV1 TaxID=631454 RepID=V4RRN7_9HYPH|nr:hypothetical protein N177_1160 [Lutibaculum baratangense AMV1]
MVPADADDVEPDAVSGFNLLREVGHAIGGRRKPPCRRRDLHSSRLAVQKSG